jgi:hypothetical protein
MISSAFAFLAKSHKNSLLKKGTMFFGIEGIEERNWLMDDGFSALKN